MSDRRDAADDEAGQLVGLAGGGAPDVPLTRDGCEAGDIDPIGPRHEREDRLQPVVGRRDEDERFDDLAELRADGRRRFRRRVGRLVEDGHLERDALARGGVDDAPDRGMVGGSGTARSLASAA